MKLRTKTSSLSKVALVASLSFASIALAPNASAAVNLVSIDFSGTPDSIAEGFDATNPQYTVVDDALVSGGTTNIVNTGGDWTYSTSGESIQNTLPGSSAFGGGNKRLVFRTGLANTGFTYEITTVQVVVSAVTGTTTLDMWIVDETVNTLVDSVSVTGVGTFTLDFVPGTFVVTDSEYSTGDSQIRINGWGTDSPSIAIDSISFLGTTTIVPEPSTYALLGGMAVLGTAMIVRRRRS